MSGLTNKGSFNQDAVGSFSDACAPFARRGCPAWKPPRRPYPALPGLTDMISFSPNEGRILLDDRRMVLFHSAAFGAMRREIIGALGLQRGADALWRIGQVQGERDAAMITQRWQNEPMSRRRAAGPGLHTLEGFAKVRTLSFEWIETTGAFRAEFLWCDSIEADEHVASFGLADHPCCWTLCGYASGFAAGLYDVALVFREVQCRATGAPSCRVVAKRAEDWEADRVANEIPTPAGRRHVPARRDSAIRNPSPEIIGGSPAFLHARRQLGRAAPTVATVLLRGESGVGKELFANALHRLSPRSAGPFVSVNCAGLPESLIESELFGVERGAFTGASQSRAGRFERASGGTLFLDEIGSMTPAAQAKVLRAVQEREIERVGGTRRMRVDVRLVAASNLDLWREVQQGRFRADLFYRVNVFPIDLPPLRECRDDIPALLDHFLDHFVRLHRKRVSGFTQSARRALSMYEYPGNVRELQNLVERGVISVEDNELIDTVHVFPHSERPTDVGLTVGHGGRLRPTEEATPEVTACAFLHPGSSLEQVERHLCQSALAEAGGNIAAAARRLGITRPTLDYRLRKWGVPT
jgi:two-component system, NtrC family, response regulator HydG